MAELLLELFSEEIPARMQTKAAYELLNLLSADIETLCQIRPEGESWVTPRRLGVCFKNIPEIVPPSHTELRGPKASAPEAAVSGFLKKYDLSKEQLREDGGYYYATLFKPETDVGNVIGEVVTGLLKNFPWPKSMRWGREQIKWVRPIHSILFLFNGGVIPVEYGAIKSGNYTFGHRFMDPKQITINNFSDYKQKLETAKVILNTEQRKKKINEDIAKLLNGKWLLLREDEGLLDEIVGLVEFPFVLLGQINQEFMHLPEEVLVITLRHHQRYMMLNDNKGELAPYFIIVANQVAEDGGLEIVRGNSKVLRARLSDARFFYEGDMKRTLSSRLSELKNLTFYEGLGSVYDKTQRIIKIASTIAKALGLNEDHAKRAAELCKTDLVTDMVKEFPELQGIMGYYYATNDSEDKEVALAIRDHYKPQGPSDSVPANKIGAIVAIADKIDTLQEMFRINIRPTGSKDPFALRRAAIGILRIINEHKLSLEIEDIVESNEVINFINDKKN